LDTPQGLEIGGKSMLTVEIFGQIVKSPTLGSKTMSVLAYINAANLFVVQMIPAIEGLQQNVVAEEASLSTLLRA
jgi:hypothetical protein